MSIYESLANVYQKIGYVQKERSAGLNYSYASERAFIEALRPAMVEEGLIIFPMAWDLLIHEAFQTARGGTMNRAVVRGIFNIRNREGDQVEVISIGEGMDSGDKAFNKAQTCALKYALRQTFMIETGDDPDTTPSDTQERASVGGIASGPVAQRTEQVVSTHKVEGSSPSGATKEWPIGYVEEDASGQLWMMCKEHGKKTRAKYWPFNEQRNLPANYSCAEKLNGAYCKGRSSVATVESLRYRVSGNFPNWWKVMTTLLMADGKTTADIKHLIDDYTEKDGAPYSDSIYKVANYMANNNMTFDHDLPAFVALVSTETDDDSGLQNDLPFDD